MIQMWNDLVELLRHLLLRQTIFKEELFQVRFIRYLSWREEFISHECLATTHLLPMFLSLVHSEHLRRMDTLEWLTPRVLQFLNCFFIFTAHLVGIPREGYGLFIWPWRLQDLAGHLHYFTFLLKGRQEFLSVLAFFEMAQLGEIVERRADKL